MQPHWQAVWRMCLHNLHFCSSPLPSSKGAGGMVPAIFEATLPEAGVQRAQPFGRGLGVSPRVLFYPPSFQEGGRGMVPATLANKRGTLALITPSRTKDRPTLEQRHGAARSRITPTPFGAGPHFQRTGAPRLPLPVAELHGRRPDHADATDRARLPRLRDQRDRGGFGRGHAGLGRANAAALAGSGGGGGPGAQAEPGAGLSSGLGRGHAGYRAAG